MKETHPLIRSLPVFGGEALPAKLGELRDEFDRAWSAFSNATRLEFILSEAALDSSDPQLLRSLFPVIADLRQTIRESWQAMTETVNVAEVVRGTGFFSMQGEPALSVVRTLDAIDDGQRDVKALESPLTDADRARIRRRRS